jgi:hypothetical protein
LHTRMLLKPMKQTAESIETNILWHVGRRSPPWSSDFNTASFIQHSQRRGMSWPAIIHVSNCKTTNITMTADMAIACMSTDH